VSVVPATHTFTDGIATSTEANAYVRDPINFLLARPLAKVRQATLQSITTATFTSITMDAEDADTNVGGTAQHDLVTNNSRFTAVYPGWYQVSGGSGWAANATGRRGCRPAVNGVLINGSGTLVPTTAAGTCQVPARTDLVYLNVGDYVEMQGFQDSGGNLNTAVSGEQMSSMDVVWVSN
jgi:hypothetical protein